MNSKTNKQKALDILRWIVALPASIIGCVIAYWLIIFINRITMARYIDPNSFMAKVFVQWLGNFALGAAFVYISVYIVPVFKKQTGIVMAAIALLLSGAFLFAAIMTRDYWAMFGTVCMNVGSLAVAWGVLKNETDKEERCSQSMEQQNFVQ